MMKTLEKEQDKIQRICVALRSQTIEPAQEEARKIVENATSRAEEIIVSAQQQSEQIINEARLTIKKERNVFESSLAQAAKQSIEALKQAIEHRLFNPELHDLISKQTADPAVIANLISAVVKAIEKEGLSGDISAYIPSAVPVQQVTALLSKEVLNKLKGQSAILGNFAGGAKVKIEGKNITLDISDAEIEDLVQRYVRKDFRKLLFG